MAESEGNSFVGQIQLLMKTHEDFSQKLKKRLVFESSKVANPVKFIAGLITNGVLCDGSDEQDATFGLKEIIVQLALTIACSKDASAICGLMESLHASNNSDLVSSLRTWIKEDFGIEISGRLGEPKGNYSNVQTPTSEVVVEHVKNSCESGSSGTKLIDKIMSRLEDGSMEQLEGHLVGKASEMINVSDFCSGLANENLLNETDMQVTTGPEVQGTKRAEKAIKAARSKRAIGSLILALQTGHNECTVGETEEWLETSPVKKKYRPIAVKSPVNERRKEKSATGGFTFFEQPARPYLLKLATFKCQQKSVTKGISALQFDKERMIALSADGTLNLWNFLGGEEESVQIAANVKNITCFQYDEEILVLGTGHGGVHLFDARTFEDKSTVNLGDPVTSLKFIESSLVVFTRNYKIIEELWWVDISRPDMRILNPRDLNRWTGREGQVPGACMYPDISYVHVNGIVFAHNTKSGNIMPDETRLLSFRAPTNVSKMTVGDSFSSERVLVAGCTDGSIKVWSTSTSSQLIPDQNLAKTFGGHEGEIVSLCTSSGHLLSLDKTGKLLMWSGYKLVRLVVGASSPLVLGENFSKVSNLASYERWFASGSSEDGTVDIWALPNLSLCAL